jgi:hypothetical protein
MTACVEDSTGPGEIGGGGAALNQIVTTSPLNASSADTLVYFSLASNSLVPRTGAWDIALRRFEVRVNGGVTGSGTVTGHNLENNRAASPAQVLAFTNTNTLAAFDSVRDARIPADSFFKADRLIPNATGYLVFGGGIPTANANFWKVKTAASTFELTRVTGVTFAGRALTSVTFESRTQSGTARCRAPLHRADRTVAGQHQPRERGGRHRRGLQLGSGAHTSALRNRRQCRVQRRHRSGRREHRLHRHHHGQRRATVRTVSLAAHGSDPE